MIQEDKDLLLKDLSARLPYGTMVEGLRTPEPLSVRNLSVIMCMSGQEYLPYLRPLSSMTEEEYNELKNISSYYGFAPFEYINDWAPNYDVIDWLNAHHFDYRGLIEKGLAIKAPIDMYKID